MMSGQDGKSNNLLRPRSQSFLRTASQNTMVSPSLRSAVSPSARSPNQAFDFQTPNSGSSTPGRVSPNGFESVSPRDNKPELGIVGIMNQIHRLAMKKDFEFTLMVVGQSGLGKSTFIRSLFMLNEDQLPQPVTVSGISETTTKVTETTVRLVERGVSLLLTLVDTPGFGDALDNSKCWEPIVEYVESKYVAYLAEETKMCRRDPISDKRVHCCLYFIPPSGRSLSLLDIEFMKQLHTLVNVIPIIAKADSLTTDELASFKQTVAKEIRDNGICPYAFPSANAKQKKLTDRAPFAVIGGNTVVDKGAGRLVRGRQYSWGFVEVDNLEHNDFDALRILMMQYHTIDLISVTRDVHYENFRRLKWAKLQEQEREFQDMFAPREAHVRQMQDQLDGTKNDYEKRLQETQRRLRAKLAKKQQEEAELERQHPGELDKAKHLKKSDSEKALSDSSFSSKGSRKSKSGTLSTVFRKGGDL